MQSISAEVTSVTDNLTGTCTLHIAATERQRQTANERMEKRKTDVEKEIKERQK